MNARLAAISMLRRERVRMLHKTCCRQTKRPGKPGLSGRRYCATQAG
jgi:hypothetical protein